MNYTGNFNLKKPESTDSYNIDDFNENADKIDEQLSNLSNPVFDEINSISEPVSGDGYRTTFGKIKKAISSLISHLSDKNNPHAVTAEQAGAAKSSHTHAASDISSGTLGTARIPTIPITKGGTGATTAANALTNLGAQKSLGFTPVRQGGGTDQLDNIIYIGWSGKVLKIQVDTTDMGEIVTTGSSNGAILPISKGGTGASSAAAALNAIMPVKTINVSDFCSLTTGDSNSGGTIAGGTVRKIGNEIYARIRVSGPTSRKNRAAQTITIKSSYLPASTFGTDPVGIVYGMTSKDGSYSPMTGYINAGGSRNGIVTCIYRETSTTYDYVDIYLHYYVG